MIKKLYKEAVNEGVFQEAYSLAGFEDTENVEELKTTLEEYGKKLDRTPNRNLSAEKYADELRSGAEPHLPCAAEGGRLGAFQDQDCL